MSNHMHNGTLYHRTQDPIQLDRLRAPIEPGKSIAGIPIGISIEEAKELLDIDFMLPGPNGDRVFSGVVLNGSVMLLFDDEKSRLCTIAATKGYSGKLLDIGEPFGPADQFTKSPDWLFYRQGRSFVHRHAKGVSISLDLGRLIIDASGKPMNIGRAIIVFDPEYPTYSKDDTLAKAVSPSWLDKMLIRYIWDK